MYCVYIHRHVTCVLVTEFGAWFYKTVLCPCLFYITYYVYIITLHIHSQQSLLIARCSQDSIVARYNYNEWLFTASRHLFIEYEQYAELDWKILDFGYSFPRFNTPIKYCDFHKFYFLCISECFQHFINFLYLYSTLKYMFIVLTGIVPITQ